MLIQLASLKEAAFISAMKILTTVGASSVIIPNQWLTCLWFINFLLIPIVNPDQPQQLSQEGSCPSKTDFLSGGSLAQAAPDFLIRLRKNKSSTGAPTATTATPSRACTGQFKPPWWFHDGCHTLRNWLTSRANVSGLIG